MVLGWSIRHDLKNNFVPSPQLFSRDQEMQVLHSSYQTRTEEQLEKIYDISSDGILNVTSRRAQKGRRSGNGDGDGLTLTPKFRSKQFGIGIKCGYRKISARII